MGATIETEHLLFECKGHITPFELFLEFFDQPQPPVRSQMGLFDLQQLGIEPLCTLLIDGEP